MIASEFTAELKKKAIAVGFDQAVICPAVTPAGINRFHEWLDAGYHGEMQYLETRREAYAHPRHVMEGAKSILVLATNYRSREPEEVRPGSGRVSKYAWGTADYHDVIHTRLKSLKRFVNDSVPEANVRGVVDTAPLLEREFAQLAGIGWQGKNTMLISKTVGSYFFLACLLLDIDLACDSPHETDHCGTCTACLDACPTSAFVQPYVLDATRCISYLTIELRDEVPLELRSDMGDWVFGCDVCQDVCPWNRHAPVTGEAPFAPNPELDPLDLHSLFELDDDSFRARFRKTPLWRAKRRGVLRNAAIVLANQVSRCSDNSAGNLRSTIETLGKGIVDSEPLVRSTAAWAIGEVAGVLTLADAKSTCERILQDRKRIESDAGVVESIDQALSQLEMR